MRTSCIKIITLLVSFQLLMTHVHSQSMVKGFIDPPDSARPWLYWFWLNGNITKEGITADLGAMQRVGIGGVIIMEVDQGTPKGPYAFGSKDWRNLFEYMLSEANRLGIKVNMNNDAGWTGSGGPWITVDKSMQKIVSTETMVSGGQRYEGKLAQPEGVNDYYKDIMVLAFPTPEGDDKKLSDYSPEISSSMSNAEFEGEYLVDNDMKTKTELSEVSEGHPQYVDFHFPKPFSSSSLTIHIAGEGWPNYTVLGEVQVSDDGKNFRDVKAFEGEAPQFSVEYDEISARWYRIVFNKAEKDNSVKDKISITEVEMSGTRLIQSAEKASFISSENPINVPLTFHKVSSKYTVQSSKILNVSDKMREDGTFSWYVPSGKWTILRIGHTTTGKFNHPAPEGGLGYECDKLSKEATTIEFNGLIKKLADDSRDLVGKSFVSTHIDSWEIGTQNWTPGFYEEFKKRRGYDPVRYLPAMMGVIVDNVEVSERFLWDLRKTVSDLMLENYVGTLLQLAHQNGLRLSIEAYDKNPANDLVYGGMADEPMAEFWSWDKYSGSIWCTEMSSSAHVYGKRILGAEAFTANDNEKWQSYPGNIKDLGDWAFCQGINRFVIHRYAMQPYENIRPGVSMGPWGLHYERTQTWWEESVSWHKYLARCQYLLQQGLFVADICYLTSEAVPQTWRTPMNRDSAAYNFDGCPPEAVLTRMSVKDGRIVLPDGMNYKILVLSSSETMTPALLKKIKDLAEAGATIVGAPPKKACGLTNYPASDAEIKNLTGEIWGKCDGKTIKENRIGKGRIIYGKTPEEVLNEMSVERDFSSDVFLRYTHRQIQGTDVYFVANPSEKSINARCQFRISGMQPELWDPMTGTITKSAMYEKADGSTKMDLSLAPAGSVFVVFRPENKAGISVSNLTLNGEHQDVAISQDDQQRFAMNVRKAGNYKLLVSDGKTVGFEVKSVAEPLELNGPWEVHFLNGMGAPEKTTFEKLISWTKDDVPAIKYYSGSANYIKSVIIPKEMIGKDNKLELDLGKVDIMAEVRVNRTLLGTLWKKPYRIDITDAIKAGKNTIEIKVVNLWVNRLIGDEQLTDSSDRKPDGSLVSWPSWVTEGKKDPTGRHSFTTWKLWKKDSPLSESGLLGPVRIISEKHVVLKSKN